MKKILFVLLFVSSFSFAQEHFRKDIEAFKAQDSINGIQKGRILFVGSSTFTIWKDVADYFPGYSIVNRGFGGSSLRDVIYYFNDVVKPYKPKQIILYEGDNDLARDYPISEYVKDVECFIRLVQIHFPNVEMCIISTKPSPSRKKYSDKYEYANELVKEICERTTSLRYIDTWKIMFDENGKIRKEYFGDDMLHMNSKGYGAWREVIRPYLIK